MRPRTYMLSTFALSAAIVLGIPASAADLPKEGKYKGTVSGYGTTKSIPVGKERVLIVFDENGINLTDGLTDHMAYHCWGTADIIQGVEQDQGYCLGTDIAGDQFVQTLTSKHPADAPSYDVSVVTSYGTGKYTGISGTEQDKCHSGEFKAPGEGAYLQHCEIEGSYKLTPK